MYIPASILPVVKVLQEGENAKAIKLIQQLDVDKD